MKPRRSLSILAVFVMMSGSLLGSEPEKRLQVRWGELGKLIGGKKVALQLAEGARVEGRVRKVTWNSLVVKVKRTSNPAAYPKGRTEIPREAVSQIEVRRSHYANQAREVGRIGLTGAVFVGALIGSVYALVGGNAKESEPNDAQFGVSVGIGTVVAVLTYRALRPRGITLIEILPDLPGEGSRKPTDKERSSSPKQDASSSVGESLPVTSEPLILPAFKPAGIGAAAPSLLERSRSERRRQQARRAVMRQGVPLHRSGLPERQLPVARHAED